MALSEFEKAIQERMKQLSPEERKIASKTNVKKMAQRGIEARNAKAQAYIDKKAAQKAPSMAAKAGRMTAQAERAVSEGAKKMATRAASTAVEVAPKIASAAKAAGRVAPVVAAATEIVRGGKLLTDEDYRKENEAAYEDLAEKNFLQRAVEGGLGGVASIYSAGKNIADTAGAYARANRAIIDARNKQADLIARGILDEQGRPTRLREAKMSESMDRATEGATQSAAPMESEALIQALSEEPPVQPAETAPRTADVEAAYKEIETGNVPKAIPVDEETLEPKPQLDEGRMAALFRTTTGTSFNPESKADMGRMQQLRDFVSQDPSLLDKSDSKIALDFYRTL
jgi:hypothetical protein